MAGGEQSPEEIAAWEEAHKKTLERVSPGRDWPIPVQNLPDAPDPDYGGGAIGQPVDRGPLHRADDYLRENLPWSPPRTERREADAVEAGSAGSSEEDNPPPKAPVAEDDFAKGKPAAPAPVETASGASAPSTSGDSGGPVARSSPGVLVPGGMGLDKEERTVKHGHVVAPGVREAEGMAGRLQMDAAGTTREANAALYQREHEAALAKVAANETAAAQQQRLTEDRDRIVGARLAEIEALNKKAAGSPEDIWSAPHVLARMAGFLMLAIGAYTVASGGKGAAAGIPISMGGQFINGLVNQDIQAKLNERHEAGKLAGRQINLLHLHEERMGNQSKAIEATKLAYYDNVLQQMEAYKAEHAGQINEANYNNLQAQILQQQAMTANGLAKQEQADVTDHLVSTMKEPKMLGGGAAGPTSDIPHQIRLADGTTYALPTEAIHKEALKHITYRQQLQALDNEALQVRAKLSKLNPATDRQEFMTQKGILERIGQDRLNTISVAADQGVVNASDRKAEEAHGTAITAGYDPAQSLGHGVPGWQQLTDQERRAGDAGLRAEIVRNQKAQQLVLDAARARVVTPGYNVDPKTGLKTPVAMFTGKDRSPAPALAPAGSKSADPKIKEYPTMGARSEGEATPKAPVLSERPTDLPTPASHHAKKKKK